MPVCLSPPLPALRATERALRERIAALEASEASATAEAAAARQRADELQCRLARMGSEGENAWVTPGTLGAVGSGSTTRKVCDVVRLLYVCSAAIKQAAALQWRLCVEALSHQIGSLRLDNVCRADSLLLSAHIFSAVSTAQRRNCTPPDRHDCVRNASV